MNRTSMIEYQSRLEYGLNDKWNHKSVMYDIDKVYPSGTKYESIYKTYTTNKGHKVDEDIEDCIIIFVPTGLNLQQSNYLRMEMVKRGHACVWEHTHHKIYNREIMLQQIDKA